MAIDIYSKSSVDTLLAPKLSVSSLSNGATTTLNATAPTSGQVLSFDGTDLVWATGGGGGGLTISTLSNGATSTLDPTAPTTGQSLTFDGTNLVWSTAGGGTYLPLSGGAMNTYAAITLTGSGTDTYIGGNYIALNDTASAGAIGFSMDYTGFSIFSSTNNVTASSDAITVQDTSGNTSHVYPSSMIVTNGSSTMTTTATGITFPDSTVQTTAATAGASRADVITISHVQNVTGIYMGGVQFTFAPINSTVAYFANLYVTDGTTTEYITGGWSETLPWTFTSSSALSTSTYLYVGAWGQTSTIPVTFP